MQAVHIFGYLLGTVIGCASRAPSVDAGAEKVVSTDVVAAETVNAASSQATETTGPASVAALIPLLKAHHSQDLPTRETLDRHEGAEEGLLWLAANADEMGVKARALMLLGLYESESSIALLDSIVSDTGQPYQLRESGFKAISSWSLEQRSARAETIGTGLSDKNPLVVIAAASAAQGVESLAGQLADTAQNHPVQMVREELAK